MPPACLPADDRAARFIGGAILVIVTPGQGTALTVRNAIAGGPELRQGLPKEPRQPKIAVLSQSTLLQ